MGASFLIALAVIVPVALFFAYLVIRVRYKKAGPDEALIVFGRRKIFGKKVRTQAGDIEGFRIIRGGGTFVWPAWEQYEVLSLRMMTLEIDMPHVYTVQGIPINVKAVAQVKVQGDIDHIRSAAEGFLGMEVEDIKATIKETVAGHLRGIVGTLTVEELYRDQRRFPGEGPRGSPRRSRRHGFRVPLLCLSRHSGRPGLPQRPRTAQDPGGSQERPYRHRRRRPRCRHPGGARPPGEGAETHQRRHRDRRGRQGPQPQGRLDQKGGRRRRRAGGQGGRDGAQGPGHPHRRPGGRAAEARAQRLDPRTGRRQEVRGGTPRRRQEVHGRAGSVSGEAAPRTGRQGAAGGRRRQGRGRVGAAAPDRSRRGRGHPRQGRGRGRGAAHSSPRPSSSTTRPVFRSRPSRCCRRSRLRSPSPWPGPGRPRSSRTAGGPATEPVRLE